MSRRRRLVREPGRLRKTVEVLVSALFGMAVVGVVLVLLQNGSAPAPGPIPTATVSGRALPTDGADGGLVSVRSAATGTADAPGTLYSASPGTAPSTADQGAQGAQETGRTEPVTPTDSPSRSQGTASAGTGSTATSSSTATPSPSSSGAGLVGVVGGLVNGVLGLL